VWQIGIPKATKDAGGAKQLATAWSGRAVLATGLATGANANANDLDGGTTTIRSAAVKLPANPASIGPMTFMYSFAHDAKSTPEDSLELFVETEDGTRTSVFAIHGSATNRNAGWVGAKVSLAAFAGHSIRIVVAATDGGADNLLEATVDDIRIRRP
jgi:aminopeptidase S